MKTKLGPVAAYFGCLDQPVQQTNSCLSSLYGSELATRVQVRSDGGMVFPSGFSSSQPNYLDYSEVAGKIIKRDNFGGYVPNSDVTFDSNVTHNGQIFAGGSFTSRGAGELHHHTFMGNLPCAVSEPEPELDPRIATTVSVPGSEGKVVPFTGGTLVDTVAYEDLTPGVEYTLDGQVRVVADGSATGIVASATFVPESASGTVEVTFEITGEQAAEYAGQALVVFEYLKAGGELVAEHADLEDEAQSVVVLAERTD
ncbi:hypothetical protein FB476_2120 [Ornithinimicrobium humiphilum]|uniref:T-Q ester bond containing domain-containing protein n=1 Tax=Ornithinimicrobium humiphilum TaxID=125288 RepID=A0A543KQ61_9MICO|nr:hypothetical protein FB476_2120 [Ornithinimicrobium humiphilum]